MTKIVEFITDPNDLKERESYVKMFESCVRTMNKKGQVIIYVNDDNIHDDLNFEDK